MRAVNGRRRAAAVLAFAACAVAVPARAQAPARDVVSVGGAATEIVYALGAGARVAAVDTTSTYPAETAALPKVGYMRALSAEGVLASAPRVLVASAQTGPAGVMEQVRASGVRVVQLPEHYDFDSLRAKVRTVGDALGVPARAAALDDALARQWEGTRAHVAALAAGRPAPRVLFILAHGDAPQIAGEGTAAAAVIALAGARNATDGFAGYKPMTPEAAIGAAPDVILTTREGLAAVGGADALLRAPGLALTPAGKARRVLAFDAMYLLGFGPRLPQAVQDLAEALWR